MFSNIPILEKLSSDFLIFVLIVFGIFFFITLIRMVKGPSIADRLLAANVLGGLVIASIAVLGLLLNESYLLDVALVYALISFLAVVILAQIYIGVFRERHASESKRKGDEE